MFLEAHRGRESAISRADLVEKINSEAPLIVKYHEREIRDTIKHLVTRHGERIGSCKNGYYMIETSEELEQACKYYHSYAMSLLHVEARLRKVALADLLGQLRMDFGG